ncbi:MAG: NAD-dependent DNA ligase LigA, partial [Bacteroidia bacterium]|nr:NAD-dependent DNA ligase LigA [Bacteroidia bacterium]
VNTSKRRKGQKRIKYISKCPECNSSLKREEGEAQHYCPNIYECPPQIKGRIEHFIARKAMDIDGLGAETVDVLVDKGLIANSADLYDLKKQELLELDRMAEKSVNNLLKGVEDSKKIGFERVLFALGIRFVGDTVAKKLAQHFKSLDALRSASLEDLIDVEDIGERIAESVVSFFKDPYNKRIVSKLEKAGLQFELQESENSKLSDKLKDLTFVVSGIFENYSRDGIKETIVQHGGKTVSSVSAKTNFLLAGEKIGPSKLSKAEKLKVKILDEKAFERMIK